MEECQDVYFVAFIFFQFLLDLKKAKINLVRHLDDDDVINGKMMFVGTNILRDLPFSP